MHDIVANSLLQAIEQIVRNSKEQVRQAKVQTHLLRAILRHLNPADRVLGGTFQQIPSGDNMSTSLVPIQPGQSPKFRVTPTFSGAAFTLDGTKAAISTSDSVNAPAELDLTDDPQGETFVINLTPGVTIPTGGEAITVDWSYTNEDGVVAHVTGTLTEEGIVDDVTGGIFEQVA